MWEKIKTYFQNRKINQVLAQGKKIAHDFIDIEKAKSIGLIININQCIPEDIKDIHSYMDATRAKGIKVILFEINYLKKTTPTFGTSAHSVFINAEKINWVDCPSEAAQGLIKQYDMDILINFDISERMTSHFIAAISQARTRTFIYKEGFSTFYELMVVFKEVRFKRMLQNYEHFLKMIEQ